MIFLSFFQKFLQNRGCSQQCLLSNQIPGFFDYQVPGKNQLILQFFCLGLSISGTQHPKLPHLVGCGKVCHLYSQIAGLFDYWYLLKGAIDLLVFFSHRVMKGRQHLRLPFLVRLVVPVTQSDCRKSHQGNLASVRIYFWFGVARCALCPIR